MFSSWKAFDYGFKISALATLIYVIHYKSIEWTGMICLGIALICAGIAAILFENQGE